MSSVREDVRRLRATARETFSRSPHPYHRKALTLRRHHDADSTTDLSANDGMRSSDSSEDHAVEADDEKGPLLRLPAPPIKGRKGLKGVHDPSVDLTPVASPLPTPPTTADGFDFGAHHEKLDTQVVPKQADEKYSKYARRRKGEVVRRITETMLLVTIGLLSVFTTCCSLLQPGSLFHKGLYLWLSELNFFISTVLSLYAAFPIRRSIRFLSSGWNLRTSLRTGFHVPSRFDPGVLLYPVFLPLLITASLNAYDAQVPVNIVLGLSSLPASVIPFRSDSSVHWFLSVLPISQVPPFQRHLSMLKLSQSTTTSISDLVLLFPLHQNLVGVISNLVTTSLDPSEVLLLSSGLINLLLFASTPQSQILKALLWVGGLCLFIFCERALKAEVALARIPAWRFARNKPSRKGLLGRFNKILRAILPEARSRFAAIASSSSDDDEVSKMLHPGKVTRKSRAQQLRHDSLNSVLHKTMSADEDSLNGHISSAALRRRTTRSATFSTFGRAASLAIKWRNIANSSNPYLRLNYLHAQALKMGLALYTYAVTAAIILVPVRYFINIRALNRQEAVGWALGYFLGDLSRVRMLAVNNNLDWWIRLPIHRTHVQLQTNAGWLERYQKQVIGLANMRILLAGYCVLVVGMGLVAVLQLKSLVEVDTRRKVFHGVMVAMLLPTIPIDPCFFGLALMIVLAVFLMLDLFRASQLPPISKPLTNFLAPYVDGRDHRGPVIVSHIFLLIGCAIPLWLSLTSTRRIGEGPWVGWDVASRDVSMVSGVVCVGMGDAAASLIGRRYGRTKWYWGGGKSIEGSAAFAVAVLVGLTLSWLWLRIGGWERFELVELPIAIAKAGLAGTGASVMESTLTAANDNVVVPIGLWLLVRGLQI